jgi:hypothetical protein
MRGQNAAAAADVTSFGGKPTKSPAELDLARTDRQAAITKIFLRLRRLLKQRKGDIVQREGGGELRALSQAFEKWLDAALVKGQWRFRRGKKVREALRIASAKLETEIYAFLKTL